MTASWNRLVAWPKEIEAARVVRTPDAGSNRREGATARRAQQHVGVGVPTGIRRSVAGTFEGIMRRTRETSPERDR
jgi:hypothetical protein